MRKYLQLAVVMVALTMQLTAQFSVPKALVFEDHTGAWCGWCVLGNQALEDLHAEYGDRVIPLAFHNRDSMTLPLQTVLAKKFGLTGYPSGVINRTDWLVNGVTSSTVHPTDWADLAKNALPLTSPLEVKIDYTIDKSSQKLTAIIHAKALADIPKQLGYVFVLAEDSVTGAGTGWDQTNYLSGVSAWKGHPYYYLPSTVTNYYHQNVIREMIGGDTAIIGSLPPQLGAQEEYSQTFTFDLKKYPIQHLEHLWVAGMVVETGDKYSVINAASAGKKPTPKSVLWIAPISATEKYAKRSRGTTVSRTFWVKNDHDTTIETHVFLDKTTSIIPDGWTFTQSDTLVRVRAKDSTMVTVNVKIGDTPGFGTLAFTALVKQFGDVRGLPQTASVYLLSDGVKNAILSFKTDDPKTDNEVLSTYNSLPSYQPGTAYIPLHSDFAKQIDLSDFKLLYVLENFSTRGELVIYFPDMVKKIDAFFRSGKPVLFTSPIGLWFTAGNYPSFSPPQYVADIFEQSFGITSPSYEWNPALFWNGSVADVIPVKGIAGEAVSQGFSFSLNQVDNTHKKIQTWIDAISIVSPTLATPIMKFNYKPKITDEMSLAAVKIKNYGTRAIYQGFGFDVIKNEPTRKTLLSNYLDWLTGVLPESAREEADLTNPAHLAIYPSVTSDKIRAEFQAYTNDAHLEIVDGNGRTLEVVSPAQTTANAANTIILDVHTLPTGTYYLTLVEKGIRSTMPFKVLK